MQSQLAPIGRKISANKQTKVCRTTKSQTQPNVYNKCIHVHVFNNYNTHTVNKCDQGTLRKSVHKIFQNPQIGKRSEDKLAKPQEASATHIEARPPPPFQRTCFRNHKKRRQPTEHLERKNLRNSCGFAQEHGSPQTVLG